MTLYDQDNTEVNEVIEIVSCEETDIWQEAEEIETAKPKIHDWIVAAIALVATICVVVAFTMAQMNQHEGFESGLQIESQYDMVGS